VRLNKRVTESKQEKQRKILFWNIADVEEKDLDFWSYVKGYDFVSLCEVWLDEKGWNTVKDRLLKTHVWDCSYTRKEREKGNKEDRLISKGKDRSFVYSLSIRRIRR